MEIDIVYDCSEADWKAVSETLKSVGMAYEEPEVHKRAFEASHTTVFVYQAGRQAGRLIGFGRAISDGAYQAAVYDIAVVPDFQKMGIGRMIMEKILERLSGCNVILYASPGKEDFYRKLGLRKMKTGMALFRNPDRMAQRGFTE
ncbi:MAG TPA: GNAT family N-acetyltransferase [Smithella sp.]|nr:GNAT family N-acetyltransferase [Smithella sp.]